VFATQRLTVVAGVIAAAATLLILAIEPLRFAYEGDEIHVAIVTAVALIGMLAAGLVLARFQRSGRLRDLALFAALAVLALNNLLYGSVPAAFGAINTNFAGWAPLIGRVVGTLLLAVSVALPDRRVEDRRPAALWTFGGCLAVLTAIGLAAAQWAPGWSTPLPPGLTAADSGSPSFDRPAAALLEFVLVGLFVVAAIGFVTRAKRDPQDPLIGAFAVAMPLGAAASVNYALFPSLYAGWVYTGDVFRLGFYAMLLVGAARELVAWQAQLAEAAVLRERRRIARDLHDGLAQELAFIVGQTRSLADMSGSSGGFDHLVAAAERALDESRNAIAAMTRPVDEPLDVALAQAAEDVAGRVGAKVRFDLERNLRVAPEVREDLARIVREAVTNAARHGNASTVTLTLNDNGGIRVRIADDGDGFDPESPGRRGFGLTSMRERAQANGGELTIRSEPGGGTQVEVVIP